MSVTVRTGSDRQEAPRIQQLSVEFGAEPLRSEPAPGDAVCGDADGATLKARGRPDTVAAKVYHH
jgi:hypothetical protein